MMSEHEPAGEKIISPEVEWNRHPALKIARAFVNQSFPLSDQGMSFKERVEAALQEDDRKRLVKWYENDDLPTVESPQIKLFKELDLTEEERIHVFGSELVDIQVSEGCSHDCAEFCAYDSPKELTFMPFAGFLRCALNMVKTDDEAAEEWRRWEKMLKAKDGIDIYATPPKEFIDKASREELVHLGERLLLRLPESRLIDYLSLVPYHPDVSLGRLKSTYYVYMFPFNFACYKFKLLNNYFNSDPFDYRDKNFRHRDGTVADYGDVFNVMAYGIRPTSIITAGWMPNDQVALRAIHKIKEVVAENPQSIGGVGLSVNRRERAARGDKVNYLVKTINVMGEIAMLDPEVRVYFDPRIEGDEIEADGTIAFLEKFGKERLGREFNIQKIRISRFSGRAASLGEEPKDTDIAFNAGGIHIKPNGEVWRQELPEWRLDPEYDKMMYVSPKGAGL
ncbi:MAG TPA: hypothetical protein PK263_02410 [bacterium]|nr:hypothetical protein [bacterium]